MTAAANQAAVNAMYWAYRSNFVWTAYSGLDDVVAEVYDYYGQILTVEASNGAGP